MEGGDAERRGVTLLIVAAVRNQDLAELLLIVGVLAPVAFALTPMASAFTRTPSGLPSSGAR